MRWEAAQSKPNLVNEDSEDGEIKEKRKDCSIKHEEDKRIFLYKKFIVI